MKPGQLLKLKCVHSPLNLRILSSTSVLFAFTTEQVPNLALTHTKLITVSLDSRVRIGPWQVRLKVNKKTTDPLLVNGHPDNTTDSYVWFLIEFKNNKMWIETM
jgi:hypothetical protein